MGKLYPELRIPVKTFLNAAVMWRPPFVFNVGLYQFNSSRLRISSLVIRFLFCANYIGRDFLREHIFREVSTISDPSSGTLYSQTVDWG